MLVQFVFRRPWWTVAPIWTAPSNNLALSSSRWAAPLHLLHPLLPYGCHGDRKERFLDVCCGGVPSGSAAVFFLSSFSAVPRRPWADSLSTLLAERRPYSASSTPAASRRPFSTNLPVGVPKGRPHSRASTAFFGILVPSGVVPGDLGAGRDRRQKSRVFSGLGPDCFFSESSRVLYVIFNPQSVSSYSRRGWSVMCTTVLI